MLVHSLASKLCKNCRPSETNVLDPRPPIRPSIQISSSGQLVEYFDINSNIKYASGICIWKVLRWMFDIEYRISNIKIFSDGCLTLNIEYQTSKYPFKFTYL